MGIKASFVSCCAVLLIIVFFSGIAIAGSLEDAAYTLNSVESSLVPDNFIEISSIECSSQKLPGYTDIKTSSLGLNEWDAVDLNPGTQFNLKVINEIGAVEYLPVAYIPVIKSETVQGISLYIKKKYITNDTGHILL